MQAWAGGTKLLRLLCEEHGQAAAAGAPNVRGCTAAHWVCHAAAPRSSASSRAGTLLEAVLNRRQAASSGALSSCKYLAESCGLDFGAPNAEGATPLTKAVVQSRPPVRAQALPPRCAARLPTRLDFAAGGGVADRLAALLAR